MNSASVRLEGGETTLNLAASHHDDVSAHGMVAEKNTHAFVLAIWAWNLSTPGNLPSALFARRSLCLERGIALGSGAGPLIFGSAETQAIERTTPNNVFSRLTMVDRKSLSDTRGKSQRLNVSF